MAVFQIQNNQVVATYSDVALASKLTGADTSHIYKVAKGVRGSAGGYSWNHDPDMVLTTKTRIATRNAGLKQIDSAGNVVAIYTNLDFAATTSGVSAKQIQAVLEGKRRTAGGYFWLS